MKRKDYDKISEKIAKLYETLERANMWDIEEVYDVLFKLRSLEDAVIDKVTLCSRCKKRK